MTTINAVGNGLSGTTGTGSFVGNSSPSLTTPKITTNLSDSSGNSWIIVTGGGNANQFTMANGTTTNFPSISSTGSDTNIGMTLGVKASAPFQFQSSTLANGINLSCAATTASPTITFTGTDTNVIGTLNGKGTGGVTILGTSTNDNAASGYVGEFVSSQILDANAISLTTATITNVTSISLTAGDWDVSGNVSYSGGATTLVKLLDGWINSTSVTAPDASLYAAMSFGTTGVALFAEGHNNFVVPPRRFSLSTTTTIYLTVYADFSTSTCLVSGFIGARRRR